MAFAVETKRATTRCRAIARSYAIEAWVSQCTRDQRDKGVTTHVLSRLTTLPVSWSRSLIS